MESTKLSTAIGVNDGSGLGFIEFRPSQVAASVDEWMEEIRRALPGLVEDERRFLEENALNRGTGASPERLDRIAAGKAARVRVRENSAVPRKKSGRYFVYRYFNHEGDLLYVGYTASPSQRDSQHSYQADWYLEAHWVEYTGYDSKDVADVAEYRAIVDEEPIFNKRRHFSPSAR